MPKTIRVQLSVESIDRAIKEIYARREQVSKKVNEVIERMVQAGEKFAIKEIFDHIYTGETVSSVMGYRDGNRGVIVAGGAAIWLEFGTGVIKNMQQGHPKAAELGIMPWGSYGLGHGGDPNGWWYYGDDGKVHHTNGIQATMFMYRTAKYLQAEFPRLAREVFDNDRY